MQQHERGGSYGFGWGGREGDLPAEAEDPGCAFHQVVLADGEPVGGLHDGRAGEAVGLEWRERQGGDASSRR